MRCRIFQLAMSILIFITFSCKKKENVACKTDNALISNSFLVLNEGLFQQNNASLSQIDKSSLSTSSLFFEEKTGRPLGDTGNDMKRYGNKIYIVVNVSSTIEVLDAMTGQSQKQISMVHNGIPKQPRFITFANGKAFVSCFDGYIDVLDTVSLVITKRIKVGQNPEQLAISNNKLYVANSGGLNFPNVDSTVSVVALSSESEITKISVGNNPGPLITDSEGDVYVISRGNYSTIPSRMHKISSVTDTKVHSFSFDVEDFTSAKNQLILFTNVSGQSRVMLFDAISETTISSDFINTSEIKTLYKIQYLKETNTFFCFDAQNYVHSGIVSEYTLTGTFLRKFNTGLNPKSILSYD